MEIRKGNGLGLGMGVGWEVDVLGLFGWGENGMEVFGVGFDEVVFDGEVVLGMDGRVFGEEVGEVVVGG